MKKKIIGILIVGLLIVTAFPTVSASIHKTDDKENEIAYESSLSGIGFVRIHENVIKGFVLFGIIDGQVISTEWINIKYNGADGVYAGFFPPLQLTFYIRYNPA
jgi:hypothetical protein